MIIGERSKLHRERLVRMLGEFSLLKLANQYPHSLTRVEYSMTQFARAAIANQPLVIIDEPLAGLDPKSYRRVLEFLSRLALSGCSLIMLVSELPQREIPDCRTLHLSNGSLQ